MYTHTHTHTAHLLLAARSLRPPSAPHSLGVAPPPPLLALLNAAPVLMEIGLEGFSFMSRFR
jgi:hypothetical protein